MELLLGGLLGELVLPARHMTGTWAHNVHMGGLQTALHTAEGMLLAHDGALHGFLQDSQAQKIHTITPHVSLNTACYAEPGVALSQRHSCISGRQLHCSYDCLGIEA